MEVAAWSPLRGSVSASEVAVVSASGSTLLSCEILHRPFQRFITVTFEVVKSCETPPNVLITLTFVREVAVDLHRLQGVVDEEATDDLVSLAGFDLKAVPGPKNVHARRPMAS